jgi:glutathione S-transferase
MKLYAYRYCPYSRRVRIALAENGVEYEYVELAPDAEYPPELRGLVPGNSGVPVLFVRDDFAVWDSSAIVHWIDSAYPRSLFPSQLDPQAHARAWQGWAQRMYSSVTELREGDADKARDKILKTLASIDGMIGPDWLVDTEFSVADAAMGPVIGALSSKDLESLPPRVRAYAGKLRARQSVRDVCELDLPEEQRPSFAA